MDLVEVVQKVYLGVGKMFIVDEVCEFVNRYGVGLFVFGLDFFNESNNGGVDGQLLNFDL